MVTDSLVTEIEEYLSSKKQRKKVQLPVAQSNEIDVFYGLSAWEVDFAAKYVAQPRKTLKEWSKELHVPYITILRVSKRPEFDLFVKDLQREPLIEVKKKLGELYTIWIKTSLDIMLNGSNEERIEVLKIVSNHLKSDSSSAGGTKNTVVVNNTQQLSQTYDLSRLEMGELESFQELVDKVLLPGGNDHF